MLLAAEHSWQRNRFKKGLVVIAQARPFFAPAAADPLVLVQKPAALSKALISWSSVTRLSSVMDRARKVD